MLLGLVENLILMVLFFYLYFLFTYGFIYIEQAIARLCNYSIRSYNTLNNVNLSNVYRVIFQSIQI